jgi:hypothetical protein
MQIDVHLALEPAMGIARLAAAHLFFEAILSTSGSLWMKLFLLFTLCSRLFVLRRYLATYQLNRLRTPTTFVRPSIASASPASCSWCSVLCLLDTTSLPSLSISCAGTNSPIPASCNALMTAELPVAGAAKKAKPNSLDI